MSDINTHLGVETVCIHGGHEADAHRAHLTPKVKNPVIFMGVLVIQLFMK